MVKTFNEDSGIKIMIKQELAGYVLLEDVLKYIGETGDFKAWATDRLMESYKSIRIWTELILYKQNPATQRGNHTGIALLFPMEYLFEDYVAYHLRKQLPSGWRLRTQVQDHSLVANHNEKPMFRLKPDLLLEGPDEKKIVLDTKWKLLDETNRQDKYGISQSDIYQMYAYGKKYMDGKGDVYLIYPEHEKFKIELDTFSFNVDLRLNVIPFGLQNKFISSHLESNWAVI